MGKGTLILALAGSFIALTMMNSTFTTSRETQIVHNRDAANTIARDLAMQGRKLALSSWLASSAKSTSSPFNTITKEGGSISLTNYASVDDVLDITVRGIYDGAVHDVRSRYEWHEFGLNPLQIKAAEIEFDVDPATKLDFENIVIDDQSLQELDETLIQELDLANNLSELDLGASKLISHINSELGSTGHNDVSATLIDQSDRDALEQENGMYFPDQVEQAVSGYIAANPGLLTTINDDSYLPGSFGTGKEVLKVADDLTISGSFTGSGILVVEGSFVVPAGASFSWDGLILVKPPSTDLNPVIDLAGTVNINGGLVALHEAIPNTGHLDVTTFRDYSGVWSGPEGTEHILSMYGWYWCMYHLHDFTSHYGNNVRYHSDVSSERIHETEVRLFETISALNSWDQVFLEISNSAMHGRGILTMELEGEDRTSYPVAAGFDPLIASPSNAYRTRTFSVSDLNYMHFDISRLSSLQKMWDPSDEPYPGCYANGGMSGPICIGNDYNRMGSLTFRLYKMDAGTEKRIYEASMYWHRRTDEEAAFNEKMDQLVEDIKSPDYGLSISFGSAVSITTSDQALNMLGKFSGINRGLTHLGTWQNHWDPLDEDNPVKSAEPKSE